MAIPRVKACAAMLAVTLVAGLLALGGATIAAASARAPGRPASTSQTSPPSSQAPDGGTTSVVTTQNVLEGSPNSAAATSTSVSAAVTGGQNNGASSTVNYKIWAVVGALVLVALLIGWWTVRYWRATDPHSARAVLREEQPTERKGRQPDEPPEPGSAEDAKRRRSRYSDLVITVTPADDRDG